MSSENFGINESRYRAIRKHLDDMGYKYPLSLNCLSLVEHLLADLLNATENLNHFKELAHRNIEDHHNFENAAEPYKEDNARLVQECNKLNLSLNNQKEEYEKKLKDLRKRLRKLESDYSDLKFIHGQQQSKIKSLELESATKTAKLLELEERNSPPVVNITGSKTKKRSSSRTPTLEIDEPLKPSKNWKEQYSSAVSQAKDPLIVNMVEMADQRIACLCREVKHLKEDRTQQTSFIETLKSKLKEQDKEILRLTTLLKGGRPTSAVCKDACQSGTDQRILKLTEEVSFLKKANMEMQSLLKESVAKQHEAMTRALRLAERNKQLELELHDIDRIALAVEHECTSTVQENSKRVSKIQEKLAASLSQVTDLEQEVLELKRNNQELQADLEGCRKEKKHLQRNLDDSLAEKKRLNDQINELTVLERDLRSEIEKLKKAVKTEEERTERIESFSRKSSLKKDDENILVNGEENAELRRKLNEKEAELIRLQQVNREISRDRHNLQTRLESVMKRDVREICTGTSPIPDNNTSIQCVMKRLEKERDLAKADIERLEEERDALRERLKVATETQVAEHARLEKTILESEDRVRKLEAERRELMTKQGSHNATINNLEDQVETYREQAHAAQMELSQQRTLYNQVKSLQEETDRALADSQSQLTQLEMELSNAQERIRVLERDRASLDHEVSTLKNERTILRGSLAQVDQEKDALLLSVDNKTERIAKIEQELKVKENKILNLEDCLNELKKKFEISVEENCNREQVLRNTEREVSDLRMKVDAAERAREGLMRENRRLQDDIASLTSDCRIANRDLNLAKDEIETLKRQLQDYVDEIRRIEDLLAQKENERTEMLEQFRGLSMEATTLESNNHSLENESQEYRNQLSIAQDQISDLQHELEMRDTLVQNYELQIADLSARVASNETQIQLLCDENQKLSTDLDAVRDLCVKLDAQKDSLMQQNSECESLKQQLESEVTRLRQDQRMFEEQVTKDRNTIKSLENLLADSRQETMDHKISVQELQSEISRLRQKMTDLQNKLEASGEEIRRYQQKASEAAQNAEQMQRQATNERFERMRFAEDSQSSYSTL